MATPKNRPSKPERRRLIEEAVRLRLEGLTYREIASTLGLSPTCVRRYVDLGGYAGRQPEQILGADGKLRVSRYHKGR